MPDYSNPYNAAQDDVAGRMRALGMLPNYQPPAAAQAYGIPDLAPDAEPAPAANAPDLSWHSFKRQNNYDATDYTDKRRIWDEYQAKIIPSIAQYTGDDEQAVRASFLQKFAADKPTEPQRSVAEAALGDPLSALARGAAGTAKSVSDLVAPDSAVSKWLADEQKHYADNASPVVKDDSARTAREVAEERAAGGAGIMPTLRGMARNPVQTVGEFAGGMLPYAAAGALTGGVGVAALAAAQGGGQVRGAIYEKLQSSPDAVLQSKSPAYAKLRQAGMSEADAKSELASVARRWPEIFGAGVLNAVTARLGPVERRLSGLSTGMSRPAAAGIEALTNAAQSAGTQVAQNAAIRGAFPDQSLTDDVALQAVQGGVLGGLAGGAMGVRPHASTEPVVPPVEAPGADAPLALPPPTRALPAPDGVPQDAPNFQTQGAPYNVTSDDVAAIVGSLKTIANRETIANHLESGMRTGTLEDLAHQNNSVGRAAQALLARIAERAKPRALDEPSETPALPAPTDAAPSGDMLVDSGGAARPQTYGEAAAARVARDAGVEAGLTSDVRNAQEARTRSGAQEDGPVADASVGDASPMSSDVSAPQMVLQNRDRSSSAAIHQMNDIAANPDPGRLSFSRDFANGAPVVEANPGVEIPADRLGRQDFAIASDGRRIPVQYAVVDADTLLPSNNADGSSVAAYAQGAPDKLRAIAGNARVAGLKAAYDRGTTAAYRAMIAQDQPLTGVSASGVQGLHNPVLVRIMPRDHVTADIGDASNTVGTAALSPIEQAQNDANRVNLDGLHFTDAGEPTPQSVREFVRSMPVSERVGLLNPDGTPTRQAIDRVMAATFQKAYGDPELVRLYAQANDPEARTVLGGMADAAGAMSRLDGAGDLDIRPLVTEAARAAVNARRKGVKLSDFARQHDIALSPDAREFVQLFADNARSGKRIGETLKNVADFAHTEATKPAEDMFGAVERANRAQVLARVNDTTRTQDLGVAAGREPAAQSTEGKGADATRSGNDQPAEAVGAARSGEAAGPHAGGRGAGADVAPLLTNPTSQTLRERVEQLNAAKVEKERAQREADHRTQADEQRKDFKLTGSDREAEVAAASGQDSLLSRSAIKSVEANVRRGRAAMNRAISEKRDVNRAMFRSGLGWIDFVHGDDRKGIQHIIRQRTTKDGLTESEAKRMLTESIVDTIARGEVTRSVEVGPSKHVTIDHGRHEAVLTQRKGGNGWLLTGWEKWDEAKQKGEGVGAGATGKGKDSTSPTRSGSTLARPGTGATPVVSGPERPSRSREERYAAGHFESGSPLGADDRPIIKPPKKDASQFSNEAPPREGLRASGGMKAEDVRRAIADDTFNHDVDVYESIADAPANVRRQAEAAGAHDVEGFFDPRTNRVALISENLASPERAREVARHELVGHYGLENMIGRDTMRELAAKVATAERLGNKTFREIGAEVDRTQPDLPADRRAKEIIAMMAERNMHNSVVRRVLDGVRQFLKKLGVVKGDVSDAEVAKLLRDTQDYLRERGRGSIAGTTAEPAFSKNRDDAAFSRAASPIQSSVPLVEKRKTWLDHLRGVRAEPEKARAAARTLLSEGGKAAQPKWLEDAVTKLWDYRNPIEQLIRRTGNTPAGRALRNTMRLFEAASQKQIHDVERQHVDPMIDTLSKAWNSKYSKLPWYKEHGHEQFMQDIGTIGNLVKHGRERNREIARKSDGKDMAGSGKTDAEIAAIERDIRRDAPGLVELYEQIYKDHLKPMLDARDKTLGDAGLLTPEAQAARPKYDWYVPLYGDPNAHPEDAPTGSGGTSLKSPKDKQAMGRAGTLAENPLQNVLVASASAIQRAGMEGFKREFVNFLKDNPAAKMAARAKINDSSSKEIFEKYVGPDGIVHERVKANASVSPDAVVVRDGDKTTVAHIGDRKILDAMTGINNDAVSGLWSLPTKATRALSAVYTRYNPMFPAMNKIRDVQSMVSLVMADAPVQDKLGAARRALANNAKYMTEWRDKPGTEYHDWKERYAKLGGATTYSDLFHDNVMKNLEDAFAMRAGVDTKAKVKAGAEKVGKFVDAVNEHMEMTSRVALFKALVDSGMPEKDAALYVKNTMNFETKGTLGKQLGALYTFAGPALYDARRMAQALRTPRGAAVMAAHFAAMYGLYGALKAMGGKDDDGIDKLNKVPLSQSGRFLTMIDPSDPDGKGYKFPVGFGYGRIGLTLAAALHRYLDGVDDRGTFLSNVVKDGALSNFSPVEPTDIDPSKNTFDWAMQQFMPSIAKPLYQLATNKTGQGAPIHTLDEWASNKLHMEAGKPSTPQMWKSMAKELHDKAGIDTYPEVLQYLARNYGGGGVGEVIRTFQSLGEKAGTEQGLADIPLGQAFASRAGSYDMTTFRDNLNDLQTLQNERNYAKEQGTLEQFDTDHPAVEESVKQYQVANGQITSILKEQKNFPTNDPARRQELALEMGRRIRAIQMRVNRQYRELKGTN
ncbi:hypothetical protein SAMN05444172_2570 [Burkholderia sp. GAS332]|nr:hypothetical protein SAMN05444172_2570 [Burkholderia sp. GAS332]